MRRLRIFYASHATSSCLHSCRLWWANLYCTLRDMGHDVVAFEYDFAPHLDHADPRVPAHRQFIETNRPGLEQALLEQFERAQREQPFDLFFSYFYSAFARPHVIHSIRQRGVPAINFFCNASWQMHLIEELAPAYDWCLVPEVYRLEDYRRLGARPIYCQMAANPRVYRPYPLPIEFEVTFAGQKYADRPRYIRRLHEAGVPVRVWGPGWERPPRPGSREQAEHPPAEICSGGLSDEELIRLYSRSRISLGFSTCGDTDRSERPIKQVRLRDFEAPMSGAFYLVEYMQELEYFYDIGREIVCYHDADELVELCRYYLTHEDERRRIAEAGRRRCLNDHTWARRFESVFERLGL